MARVVLVAILLLARAAHAEPSNRDLVYTGLALAAPTYLVGVSLHEGSHALAAKLVGGEIVDVRIFPPGRDPKSGKFRFGWVYARGLRTKNQKMLFYAAPKITDALLLGGFAALVFTEGWPTSSRYGQLALTVFATGLWVDYSKDIFLFSKANDVVKMFNGWCMTGWRQVPARLVYAASIVGLGLIVARGYQRTFDDGDPGEMSARELVLPVLSSAF